MAIEDVAVRREETFAADRQTVWRALEESGWLAEEGVEVTLEEIVECRRVVMRWSQPDSPETLVELTLDEVPEGTRLLVLELPVIQLEAIGTLLEHGPSVIEGPRMLVAA